MEAQQVQFLDRVDDVPVETQRQMSMIRGRRERSETSVSTIQTAEHQWKISQVHFIDKGVRSPIDRT